MKFGLKGLKSHISVPWYWNAENDIALIEQYKPVVLKLWGAPLGSAVGLRRGSEFIVWGIYLFWMNYRCKQNIYFCGHFA
jgi:hypothetical protein